MLKPALAVSAFGMLGKEPWMWRRGAGPKSHPGWRNPLDIRAAKRLVLKRTDMPEMRHRARSVAEFGHHLW